MKVLRPNIKGELTYCNSIEENVGKGRCNHIKGHDMKNNETEKEYRKRISNKLREIKSDYNKNYRINNKIILNENEKIKPQFINGAQPKFKSDNYFIKIDEIGRYNGLSEEICSLFLDCCENIKEHAKYKTKAFFYENNGRDNSSNNGDGTNIIDMKQNCVYSPNFLNKYENTRNLYDLFTRDEFNKFKSITNHLNQFDYLINIIESKTGLNYKKYLIQQMILDLIILNPDRHLKNISVIECDDETYRTCPIYDNGLSLLATLKHYPINENLIDNIYKVTYNPFGIYDNDNLTSNHKLNRKEQINLIKTKINNDNELIKNECIIKINKLKLMNILNNYENNLYNSAYVSRAIDALKFSLNELENILWVDSNNKI